MDQAGYAALQVHKRAVIFQAVYRAFHDIACLVGRDLFLTLLIPAGLEILSG